MNILIACEESQRICIEFRALGHRAFSCDLYECSGGHPEWHIQGDCLPLLNGNCSFTTMDGAEHHVDGKWDIMICHPPCTFLTNCANRWYNEEKYGDSARKRKADREEAIKFFMEFVNADCDRVCIENPVGIMSTRYKKPTQIIQPYMFGDPERKTTCLWIRGLKPLQPTNVVEPNLSKYGTTGKTDSAWHMKFDMNLPKEERSRNRSKTYPGIAKAIAEQWSKEENWL